MPESGPTVIKAKTTKMPSTTARASRFCAGPGDKLERTRRCSSGTMGAIFSIGATRSRQPEVRGSAVAKETVVLDRPTSVMKRQRRRWDSSDVTILA